MVCYLGSYAVLRLTGVFTFEEMPDGPSIVVPLELLEDPSPIVDSLYRLCRPCMAVELVFWNWFFGGG